MRSRRDQRATVVLALVLLGGAALVLQACGDDPTLTFRADLDASQEVPTNTSQATAQVVVTLDQKAQSLTYRLDVQNIRNVTQAHFHCCAPAGANGGVVLFLFGPVAINGGPSGGSIASGTKTSADLIGGMAGKTLQDLVDQIKLGNVYANVHTGDGTPTRGPGNLPAGEIRAQVIIAPR